MASQKGYHEIMECLLDPKNPVRVDIKAMNAVSLEFSLEFMQICELC